MIYGETYEGEPQKVSIIGSSEVYSFENPKSISFAFILASRRTFYVLISRWAIFLKWRYLTAE